ncbi:MAG: transposase [Prevotella sp.]|nr:transposase [Prevotella sp.]
MSNLLLYKNEGHDKSIMDGALVRIKKRILRWDDTIVLSKWAPTIKLCTCCGEKVKLSQWDRELICPHCGYKEDRQDI